MISTLFFALAASAASPAFQFSCVTSYPTTSFVLKTEGTEAVLKIIHHNGVKYMPIHEGIITPSDLNYLKQKSEVLTKMGDQTEFRFPLDRCKKYGEGIMSCSGGERKTVGGVEMEALSINTAKIQHQTYDYNFTMYQVTLAVKITDFNPVQDVTMKYDHSECRFEF